MFEPTSRYFNVETTTLRRPDGREIAYLRRRFLPRAEALPTLAEVAVTQGDRLDNVTARTLSDPEQFWRVADANNATDPVDLVIEPGRTIRIPVPQPDGEV